MNPETQEQEAPEARLIHRFKGHARQSLSRKVRHTWRISRRSIRYAIFLGGAACVALISLIFAMIADVMLDMNARIFHAYWWSPLAVLPFGFAGLRWLTIRYAQQARGSGIPQVIAAISLPSGGQAQTVLVSAMQSMWKIILTAGGLLAGASIGREGPSVQVGAALMAAWGDWWHKRMRLKLGFRPEALIVAGAAGGLAAAFNTPLAGVVFAIEELGRGSALRWDRIVLSGVLTAGFLSLALIGNHSYFHVRETILFMHGSWGHVILCAAVNGMLGGIFAKVLLAGAPGVLPERVRSMPGRHPIYTAFFCGLIVALLGFLAQGTTYGTGYAEASNLLNGHPAHSHWFGIAKWGATIASYFAGLPGGIFTPCLAIGTGIGENIGALFHSVHETRLLALISMAAFLAAATQAPITASVIVMEMTHDQDATLFLLASTLLASFIARQFCPRPFYHAAARNFRREAIAIEEAREP